MGDKPAPFNLANSLGKYLSGEAGGAQLLLQWYEWLRRGGYIIESDVEAAYRQIIDAVIATGRVPPAKRGAKKRSSGKEASRAECYFRMTLLEKMSHHEAIKEVAAHCQCDEHTVTRDLQRHFAVVHRFSLRAIARAWSDFLAEHRPAPAARAALRAELARIESITGELVRIESITDELEP